MFAGDVPLWRELFCEEVVGKDACLWQPIHPALNLTVHVAIVYESRELILLDDLIGY